MMQFSPPRPRRHGRENIVPMINVVFLLLIFFLMTAQIAPPEPFEVTPPASSAEEPVAASDTLYISADGTLAYNTARGDAVWPLLAGRTGDAPLAVRADGGLDGGVWAALLPRLAEAGIARISLVTEPVR